MKAMARWIGWALLLAVGLQLFFVARIALLAHIDPASTAFERSEAWRQIRHDGYDGAIYFDTFPDMTGLDPVHECEVNIKTVQRMLKVVDRLEQDNRLSSAIDRQDAVSTQAIIQELMFGADH